MKLNGTLHVTEEMVLDKSGCKKRDDTFSTYHPIISFTYFVLIIGCAMFVMQPVFLVISAVSGLLYYFYLKGRTVIKTVLFLMMPVFFISAIVNPLFNHQGMTILFYLQTGNPVTLESVLYGLASGVMLISILNWFTCYQEVMTSDKFIYLFGKVIPAMSLIFSMVLRFVPKYKKQIMKVSEAQKGLNRGCVKKSFLEKSKRGMRILSIMTTWALENSVQTADSMKSRGYGLRGRTNYANYRFDRRDCVLFGVIVGLGSIVLLGSISGVIRVLYFPIIVLNETTIWSIIVYITYGILCSIPLIVNVMEDIKWHYLKSEI